MSSEILGITLLQVDYTCYGRGAPQTGTATTTSPTYTVTGVDCYEASCILRAAATNIAGNTGLYSAYGTGTTSCPTTLPSSAAATGITSETISMDTATIRWTVPSDYCGPSRTFMITVTQGSNPAVCSSTTSQTYYSCQGLMSSQSYDISVTTMISCGGSDIQSSPSTATYLHPCFITSAPKAIFNVAPNNVTLTWDSMDCGNLQYYVYWRCGNRMVRINNTTSLSFKLGPLGIRDQRSTSVYCLGQVQACNDVSCGGLSNVVTALIPLPPPPPVNIIGVVNGTSVIIYFTIEQLTDYNVLQYSLYRAHGSNGITEFYPVFENVTYAFVNFIKDEGLNASETYHYQMELHNRQGTSPRSNTIVVTSTEVGCV